MKKFLLAAASLALMTGAATAADLPSRKAEPVLPPPPPMWNGFYAGLNAGGTWGASNGVNMISAPVFLHPSAITGSIDNALYDWALPSAAGATGSMNSNNGGFIGGGQIGYNYQFLTNLVTGFEADIQGVANNNGSRAFGSFVPIG